MKAKETFPFASFVRLFCQYSYNRSTFFLLLQIRALQGAAILGRSSRRKSLDRVIKDSGVTHASRVHDVTDCRTQKGSTHGHDFSTFKHQLLFFNKLDDQSTEKLLWGYFCFYSVDFF